MFTATESVCEVAGGQLIIQQEPVTRQQLVRLASAFHTKKRLGQNFLIEPSVLQSITNALDIESGDTVVEVGPGIGFLTQFLQESGASVTAVELDRECVFALQAAPMANVNVIHGDFLRFDLSPLGRIKIVGNVPYQITTPIFCYLFGEVGEPKPWLANIDRVVLTVQYEVALRFVATPGTKDYSQLTLLTNYFCQAELLHVLPREDFYPSPKVSSAVVRFTPLAVPAVSCTNPKLLRQLIRAGFSKRRKMLRNNLSFLHFSEAELDGLFSQLHLDPQTRAERLSLAQFANITNVVDAMRAGKN